MPIVLIDKSGSERTCGHTAHAPDAPIRIYFHGAGRIIAVRGMLGANVLAGGVLAPHAIDGNKNPVSLPFHHMNPSFGRTAISFMLKGTICLAGSASRAFFGVDNQRFNHGILPSLRFRITVASYCREPEIASIYVVRTAAG
jgi:hypothetical protein